MVGEEGGTENRKNKIMVALKTEKIKFILTLSLNLPKTQIPYVVSMGVGGRSTS